MILKLHPHLPTNQFFALADILCSELASAGQSFTTVMMPSIKRIDFRAISRRQTYTGERLVFLMLLPKDLNPVIYGHLANIEWASKTTNLKLRVNIWS